MIKPIPTIKRKATVLEVLKSLSISIKQYKKTILECRRYGIK